MEKKIAIRGHKTRGEDVIKALENLGGKNLVGWEGIEEDAAYSINDQGAIDCLDLSYNQHYETYSLYTIEEYEALQQNMKGSGADTTEIGMKYNVGDKVRIQPLEWYQKETEKADCYNIFDIYWCSREMTISKIEKSQYLMEEDGQEFYWTDEMIEGLVEEETYDFLKTDKPNRPSLNDFMDMLDNEIKLPQGYQFKDENGNVINAQKIVLEKKKKEYPKTYKDCCKVLNIAVRDLDILDNMLDTTDIIYSKNLDRLLNSFRKLIICRNAYWKIAGDEMGLRKPWEYDCNSKYYTPAIICRDGYIQKVEVIYRNAVFAFPTEEMRDAFYENFKKEIEFCKELL